MVRTDLPRRWAALAIFSLLAACSATAAEPEVIAEAERQQIAGVVESFVGDLAASRLESATQRFSLAGFVDEMGRQKLLEVASPAQRSAYEGILRIGLQRHLEEQSSWGTWERPHVAHVRRVPGQDRQRLAVVHMRDKQQREATRALFWLLPADAGWQIFDWQDADSLLRTSTAKAVLLAALEGNFRSHDLLASLMRAQAAMADDDQLRAQELILGTMDSRFPGTLERARWLLLARSLVAQERPKDALEVLAQVQQADPETFDLTYLQAESYFVLGDHEQARSEAERALRQFGPDLRVFGVLADSLVRLDQISSALAVAQQALDLDPDDGHALQLLLIHAPADQESLLEQRLQRVTQLAAQFPAWMEELLAAGELEAAGRLVRLYRQRNPQDGISRYYEAETLIAGKQWKPAFALLDQAAQATDDPELARAYRRRAAGCLIQAGQPLEAYRYAEGEERVAAFAQISEHLLAQGTSQPLTELIAEHARLHPRDPNLFWARGSLLQMAEKFEEAEREFRAGLELKDLDEANRQRFLLGRWFAAAMQGKPLEAYAESPDKEEAFDQLCKLLADSRQPQPLAELIAVHRRAFPDDPHGPLWQAEQKWLTNAYGPCADLLTAHQETLLSDSLNWNRFDDRLIRSLLRTGRKEEALQAAQRSTGRDGDPWYEAVVSAATGNTAAARELLAQCLQLGYTRENFQADPDLGPALKRHADLIPTSPDSAGEKQVEPDR